MSIPPGLGPLSPQLRLSVVPSTLRPSYPPGTKIIQTAPPLFTVSIINKAGWKGNVAFNEAKFPLNGNDDSLVEGSFLVQTNGPDFTLFNMDVSFVCGFSLPIMCYCTSGGGARLSGCDKKLWALGTCPDDNKQGSCKSPLRDKIDAATKFFAPCMGLAYTFPNDMAANSNGMCQSGVVTCEVLPNGRQTTTYTLNPSVGACSGNAGAQTQAGEGMG